MSTLLAHVHAEHELVRTFVEKELGGHVERIDVQSKSSYAPTLDSLEEVEVRTRKDALNTRFLYPYKIKSNPIFVPTLYDVFYTVRVVYPPEERFEVCTVALRGEKLVILGRIVQIGLPQAAPDPLYSEYLGTFLEEE